MADYTGKIKEIIELYVGREVDFRTEVELYDAKDGQGPQIISWNVSGKTQPSTSEMDALVAQADAYIANEQVREIYKDIDAWKTRIKAIKDANPKSQMQIDCFKWQEFWDVVFTVLAGLSLVGFAIALIYLVYTDFTE